MKRYIAIGVCLLFINPLISQIEKSSSESLTGAALINKSIAYHDPQGYWEDFSGEFTLVLEMPEKEVRKSVITLDLPKEYFNLSTTQGEKSNFREISKENCRFSDQEKGTVSTNVSSKECERTKMYRDYYTYLYGLPMKLKDPGTHIQEEVRRVFFNGKEYLMASVTYDEKIGSDIWQFYFDPKTYALEVYQFFKGSDKETGEYILLSGIETVSGIKMPKDRAWFYNKDDGYLGTDKMMDQ